MEMYVRLLYVDRCRTNHTVNADNLIDAVEQAIKKVSGIYPFAAIVEIKGGSDKYQFDIQHKPYISLSTKRLDEFDVQDDSWANDEL